MLSVFVKLPMANKQVTHILYCFICVILFTINSCVNIRYIWWYYTNVYSELAKYLFFEIFCLVWAFFVVAEQTVYVHNGIYLNHAIT